MAEKAKPVEWTPDRFVKRFKSNMADMQSRYTFFLGAGCSISSGIPAAGALVRDHWLPRLRHDCGDVRDGESLDDWAKDRFPSYDAENPAGIYGEVMKDLLPALRERQQEIERLVDRKDPGYGYATLARLIDTEEYGQYCSSVLTTNFDDMVADALYLYTRRKPLVITHDSLMGFVRAADTRPLVVKLHGDARLEPRNTETETAELPEGAQQAAEKLLGGSALVFLGYGGSDNSVASFLSSLPDGTFHGGVYWINDHVPDGPFGDWLAQREAVWVNHCDFDELMLLVQEEFELPHPEKSRFDKLIDRYRETHATLVKNVQSRGDGTTESDKALKDAAEKSSKDFKDWWAVELEARKYKDSDPKKADAIYRDGIERFSHDANLLGNYANFIRTKLKDPVAAAEMYERAIDADPDHANNLGNYASFLEYKRLDLDAAEAMYNRAIDADPDHANNLGNYALFLKNERGDMDAAEAMCKRAIDADPDHADHLGNYALLLDRHRSDLDAAEAMYERALDADPNHANNLKNFAIFLQVDRCDPHAAKPFFERAREAGAVVPDVTTD